MDDLFKRNPIYSLLSYKGKCIKFFADFDSTGERKQRDVVVYMTVHELQIPPELAPQEDMLNVSGRKVNGV